MNGLYIEDIKNTIESVKNVERLYNKSIFISGSCGLVGKYLIDTLMFLNKEKNSNIRVIANSRSLESIKKNFSNYLENKYFDIYIGDINEKIKYRKKVDYIVNCASNTHPVLYASDPINTILTNIIGTANILNFATKNEARIIFLSSVEVYGSNINNIGKFTEKDFGYIDCNTLRAGYNEGKRAGEALCQAYLEKEKTEVVIARLPRLFGPTLKKDDSKALSQFINKALNNEDIVLKSDGIQYFSYLYVADAVSGILTILLNGKIGEAYNVANVECDITLKDLASLIAKSCSRKVVFDLPNSTEAKGFSKANDARLDYSKITNELSWKPIYSIEDGIKRTIKMLRN